MIRGAVDNVRPASVKYYLLFSIDIIENTQPGAAFTGTNSRSHFSRESTPVSMPAAVAWQCISAKIQNFFLAVDQ
jgi:hypothetical protein